VSQYVHSISYQVLPLFLVLASACASSSRPLGADPTFDCELRKAAFAFAEKLQAESTLKKGSLRFVHDALELSTLCHQPRLLDSHGGKGPAAADNAADDEIYGDDDAVYVDPVRGSDSQSGTQTEPLASIPAAVAMTRRSPSQSTIILRNGTYYLDDTLYLTPHDSGLTIKNFAGETPIVSGGKVLKTAWKQYAGAIWVADLTGQGIDSIPGLQVDSRRAHQARYPNSNPGVVSVRCGEECTVW
jgi:hypothetical protein